MLLNFIEALEAEHETIPQSLISLDRVAVIILGGGEGKRLAPLTKVRCKPAITFGGRYSLIDVPISHSLSSGLSQIFIIGQYLVYTLHKHVLQTYADAISQDQIQLLAPEERSGRRIWYKGTADAIRQNLDYFAEVPADYFLILSGDQLYNFHFQHLINFGIETDAEMVLAAQPVNEKDAKRMGLLRIEHGGSQLIDFYEKPETREMLDRFYTDPFTLNRLGFTEGRGRHYLGSMGIYFFKRRALFELLREDSGDDFGHHLISSQLKKGGAHAFLYDGYWEDIGTIESYYYANLALTEHSGEWKTGLQCYDERSVLISRKQHLPGARISNCRIQKSLVCEGSIVEAQEISHCVIGVRSLIGRGSQLYDSLVLGNGYYHRPHMGDEMLPPPGIGENCLIQKAIIDENVTVGNNTRLINRENHIDYDAPDGKIMVRDGIIVVPYGTILPDNYIF
jgi:glucose-1-phosphate adenylyltransferase